MLTGAVKWSAKPVGTALHEKHLDMLTRLSQSGYAWAREALAPGAMFLYVAANGFAPGYLAHAKAAGVHVIAWSLEDLYPSERDQYADIHEDRSHVQNVRARARSRFKVAGWIGVPRWLSGKPTPAGW
jgi:hypothetical protein